MRTRIELAHEIMAHPVVAFLMTNISRAGSRTSSSFKILLPSQFLARGHLKRLVGKTSQLYESNTLNAAHEGQ